VLHGRYSWVAMCQYIFLKLSNVRAWYHCSTLWPATLLSRRNPVGAKCVTDRLATTSPIVSISVARFLYEHGVLRYRYLFSVLAIGTSLLYRYYLYILTSHSCATIDFFLGYVSQQLDIALTHWYTSYLDVNLSLFFSEHHK